MQQNAKQKRLFRPRCKLGTAGCPTPQNLPENSRQPDDSKPLIRNWFRLFKKESQSRKPASHNIGKPLSPRPTSHLPEPPFYLRPSASICGQYGFLEPSNTRQPNPALQIRNGGTSRPPNPQRIAANKMIPKVLLEIGFVCSKKNLTPAMRNPAASRRFIGVHRRSSAAIINPPTAPPVTIRLVTPPTLK